MGIEARVEALPIFANGCVIGQGTGHVTKRLYVIPSKSVEEVCRGFVANGWFEDFLLMADGHPLLTFEGTGGKKHAPVSCHAFGIIIDKVGEQYVWGSDGH